MMKRVDLLGFQQSKQWAPQGISGWFKDIGVLENRCLWAAVDSDRGPDRQIAREYQIRQELVQLVHLLAGVVVSLLEEISEAS